MFDRLSGLNESGKVHNTIEGVAAKESLECAFIPRIGPDEFRLFRYGLAPSHYEVVDDGDRMPGAQQVVGDNAANVTRTTRYQNSHELSLMGRGEAMVPK